MNSIALAIPCSRPQPKFVSCLIQLVAHTTLELVATGKAKLSLFLGESTSIDVGREWLARTSIYGTAEWEQCINRTEVTHLLWLDDDMAFPSDTLMRLLAHDKAMVGANYIKRAPPFTPNAFTKLYHEIGDIARGKEGVLCQTLPESTGLEEIHGIGFGCVLMRADAVVAIPHPWFEAGYEGHIFKSEDVDFCSKFRAAGHQIYVDHDLSKQVKHIGTAEYGWEVAWAQNKLRSQQPAHDL
jgi:hypothetical protein